VSIDVALATYEGLPELDADDRPLARALEATGLEIAIAAWDDSDFDWGAARLVLLRNPWDYVHRLDQFLAWAESVERRTLLLNTVAALRWNLHKGYLVELAGAGIPVVPTELLRRGAPADLTALVERSGWRDLVIKPAVSADSWETHRIGVPSQADLERAQQVVDRLQPERDLLVQPFLAAVESSGERCLVFFDGVYSHAVRKNSLTHGGRWAGLREGTPIEAEADELEVARAVVAAAARFDPLYARVDLVRDAAGRPLLLELELAEPTLFVADSPAGLTRLVDAVLARLAGESSHSPARGLAPATRPC
jgi:glutathione synthase/RimK-type ligase-like ATP-grasp enzyme